MFYYYIITGTQVKRSTYGSVVVEETALVEGTGAVMEDGFRAMMSPRMFYRDREKSLMTEPGNF
jgi:hypothetical protein